ncbi:MAG TPA: hypothetical protein VLG76_07725 [Rhabdochlamydiaceae bacterium]|nr:hypothetical protein [Rhabdochlamydiaceae bacterium]
MSLILSALFALSPLAVDANEEKQIAAFYDRKEWFAAFLKNSDQKMVQKETTKEILQQDFPQIWQRICDATYPFITVFVGAGSGGVEIPLFEEFEQARGRGDNFVIYCEDPSQEMKNEFLAKAKERINSKIADYSLLPFQALSYLPPQSDFALASHSWYFIDGWKNIEKERNTLLKFASIVTERMGVGLITLQSQKGARYRLNANYATIKGQEKELVAEEIMAELEKLNIPYRSQLIESHLNVESCFKDGLFKPNKEGKELLSFLLLDSWDTLNVEIQDQIKANLLQQVEENGKNELVLIDYHIWISAK